MTLAQTAHVHYFQTALPTAADGIACYLLELFKCYAEAMVYTPSYHDTARLMHLETLILSRLAGRQGFDII